MSLERGAARSGAPGDEPIAPRDRSAGDRGAAAVPGDRPGLSACIVAMNEEDRIGACLASLDFCDEIVVVDAHSSDPTREIAKSAGARVIERDWAGFAAQKSFAMRQASHDWVLALDADERVSPALRAEIASLRERGFPGSAGWRMSRRSRYLGRWIRHGVWSPDRQLRLFDRRRARWVGADPHDRIELDGPAGRLHGLLLHEPYRDLDDHVSTIDRYTTLMAEALHARGRRARLLDLVLRPPARFAKSYLLKLGFLDGWRGLLLAYLAAHYVRLKYAKLLVMQRAGAPERGRGAAPAVRPERPDDLC